MNLTLSFALLITSLSSTTNTVDSFTILPFSHQKHHVVIPTSHTHSSSTNVIKNIKHNEHNTNTAFLSMVKSFTSHQQSESFLNASSTSTKRGGFSNNNNNNKSSSSSSGGGGNGNNNKKSSMAQKRKKRSQKFIPKPMERPDILDTIPNPDEWKETKSTEEQIQSMKEEEAKNKKAEEEIQSQASALIETQRKSVQVLTYVKEQVLDLPIDKIIESLQSPFGCDKVFDEFLGGELSNEMMDEGMSMFDNNKMELDLKAGLCSGEYSVAVRGGEEQYADCPRVTEFVVSLTRHLTGALNEGKEGCSLDFALDETSSMAELRTFKRSARQSSVALVTGKDADSLTNDELRSKEERPYQYIVQDSANDDESRDYRKVSVVYFLLPDGWDKECGGGITIKCTSGNEIFVEAKNDRLLVLSSDTCLHRTEEWIGNADLDGGSVIITHFVQKLE